MIRNKFLASLGILVLLFAVLAGAGLYSVRLYQNQVRDVAWRVNVLPIAHKITAQISEVQIGLGELKGILRNRLRVAALADDGYRPVLETQFHTSLLGIEQTYQEYRNVLDDRIKQIGIEDSFAQEIDTLQNIRLAVQDLETTTGQSNWSATDKGIENAEAQLLVLQKYTNTLPIFLNQELQGYSQTMQNRSIWLFCTVIFCITVSVTLMLVLVHLAYRWIFTPLQTLVAGSRQVAAGHFDYRIEVHSKDEMAELAEAMNSMTERFQDNLQQLEDSRRDLDEKIKQRSNELVRSERLASVGFLAAGVAHEINNPLMAISAAAESLQRRISGNDMEPEFLNRYLKMIQDEAFRCKGITEQLLSIARNDSKEMKSVDLVTVVADIAALVRQQSDYKAKNIQLDLPQQLRIKAHPQEMKQILLNLLSNALQNTLPDGTVTITLKRTKSEAVLIVKDDGFGMTGDVLKNAFEPFYTNRRNGNGTGLGLSITHRIIEEHHGQMEAFSGGTNQGSTFVVKLPLE